MIRLTLVALLLPLLPMQEQVPPPFRKTEEDRFWFIVRAKTAFAAWKLTYAQFQARLKKEIPSAELKFKERVANDNAGWEDWVFSVSEHRKLEPLLFAKAFDDMKIGAYYIAIQGPVTLDDKKRPVLAHGKSGMKFRLVNRALRKDDKEKPPDLAGRLAAAVKGGPKEHSVAGLLSVTDGQLVVWLESAEEAKAQGPEAPPPGQPTPSPTPAAECQYTGDLAGAQARSKLTHKPLLLVFGTTGGGCKGPKDVMDAMASSRIDLRTAEIVTVLVTDAIVAQQHRAGGGACVLLDWQGKELGRGGILGDPGPVAAMLADGLARNGAPVIWSETRAEAMRRAQKEDKRIAVLMEHADKAKLIETPELAAVRARFVWCRIPYAPNTTETQSLGAKAAGEVIVLTNTQGVLATDGGTMALASLKSFLEQHAPK